MVEFGVLLSSGLWVWFDMVRFDLICLGSDEKERKALDLERFLGTFITLTYGLWLYPHPSSPVDENVLAPCTGKIPCYII